MKKTRIECHIFSKKPIPTVKAMALCEKLFKLFSQNKIIKKAKPHSKEQPYLSLVFLDTLAARKLNKKFRQKDYATDILSFASEEKGMGLGELVFCEPVLRRQAKEHRLSFKQEMDYLLIHGFLHLLGYDHEKSRKDEVKMMRLQDKLFKRLSK
ncbi:MAG: rRNA maturation RNase YbeY [Oligoflexia bacterium]|nr:rRNA maturation RNase YbeY [Oligoflexia bacterium]